MDCHSQGIIFREEKVINKADKDKKTRWKPSTKSSWRSRGPSKQRRQVIVTFSCIWGLTNMEKQETIKLRECIWRVIQHLFQSLKNMKTWSEWWLAFGVSDHYSYSKDFLKVRKWWQAGPSPPQEDKEVQTSPKNPGKSYTTGILPPPTHCRFPSKECQQQNPS